MTVRSETSSGGGDDGRGVSLRAAPTVFQLARELILAGAMARVGVASLAEVIDHEPLYRGGGSALVGAGGRAPPEHVEAFQGAVVEEIASRPHFGGVRETLAEQLAAVSGRHLDIGAGLVAIARSSLSAYKVRHIGAYGAELFDVLGPDGLAGADFETEMGAALKVGDVLLGRLLVRAGAPRAVLSATHLPVSTGLLSQLRDVASNVHQSVDLGVARLATIAPELGSDGNLSKLRLAGAMDAAPLFLALWLHDTLVQP